MEQHELSRSGCLMAYYRWTISQKSLSTYGGESKVYRHNCPIEDFQLVGYAIADAFETVELISVPELVDILESTSLAGGRKFTKAGHSYKIDMVVYVLDDLSVIKAKHPGKGRRPIIIEKSSHPEAIRKRIDTVIDQSRT